MSFLKRTAIIQPSPPPEKIPITVQLRDRPLSEDELRALKCALILPIENFELLKPIVGRLSYYFRNIDNDEVVEILRAGLRRRGVEKRYENIQKVRVLVTTFVEEYKKLDKGSQGRVDVFDHICIKLDIEPLDIWDIFQKEVTHHAQEMTKIDIEIHTPAVVNAIAKKALSDKDDNAKALFARIAGLDKGNIINVDASTHTTNVHVESNQNLFSEFSRSIRKSDEEIEKENQKQLTEGKKDYIDAEYSNVEEKEKVA